MIREAVLSDYKAISALALQVFSIHYAARPDLFKYRQIAMERDYFEECLLDENKKIFVFEADGRLHGFCQTIRLEYKNHVIFKDSVLLEIDTMCVDERSRGQKIGRKLFEKAKEYATEIGAQRLELTVWEFNENARQFYEHLGLKARVRRMDYILE